MEVLCHAFNSEERGYFRSKPKQTLSRSLAKLVSEDVSKVEAALKQLIDNGVCESDGESYIYNRRMVRDEKQRRSKAEAGSKGGKISKPPKKRSKTEAKGGSTTPTTLTTPTSSTTTTTIKKEKDKTKDDGLPTKPVFVSNGQKILSVVEKAGGNPRSNSTRAWDSKDLGSYHDFIMTNQALSTGGKKEALRAGLRILGETADKKNLSRPLPYWKKIMKGKYPEWTQERKPSEYQQAAGMAQKPQSKQG
tara:strand:- start:2821 stop:3567 length:747 start_codon:yes stop_codon:yes gene_type:complete